MKQELDEAHVYNMRFTETKGSFVNQRLFETVAAGAQWQNWRHVLVQRWGMFTVAASVWCAVNEEVSDFLWLTGAREMDDGGGRKWKAAVAQLTEAGVCGLNVFQMFNCVLSDTTGGEDMSGSRGDRRDVCSPTCHYFLEDRVYLV